MIDTDMGSRLGMNATPTSRSRRVLAQVGIGGKRIDRRRRTIVSSIESSTGTIAVIGDRRNDGFTPIDCFH